VGCFRVLYESDGSVHRENLQWNNLEVCVFIEILEAVNLGFAVVTKIGSNHCLGVDEVIDYIKKNKNIEISIMETDKPIGVYGYNYLKITKDGQKLKRIREISAENMKLLEAHNKQFFGTYRPFLINRALSCIVKPDLYDLKNTEWKIYLSDVTHHILNWGLKVRKFNMSKSLTKVLGNTNIECGQNDEFKSIELDLLKVKTAKRNRGIGWSVQSENYRLRLDHEDKTLDSSLTENEDKSSQKDKESAEINPAFENPILQKLYKKFDGAGFFKEGGINQPILFPYLPLQKKRSGNYQILSSEKGQSTSLDL
jgi:hypothetical protein